MAFDVDRLLRLRLEPLPDDAAEAAFRQLYNDPVSINGEPIGILELVAHAKALQAAIEWPNLRVLSVVDGGAKTTVVYRLQGRQVGQLRTSIGLVPPTGRVVELRTIEVLTVAGGRIREIWTVANELGALVAADAVWLSAGEVADGGNPDYKPWEHETSAV